ncbi:cupin domain-containing protein [bacterium]|nr:cupin domain-containing protein [bacterium]
MVVKQRKIKKPWGHEIIWSHCDKFVGKILCINYQHKLSRQYHKVKEETIMVLTGTLMLEIGEGQDIKRIELKRGESFHVTPGLVHRFTAEFGDVELVEVSTPELDDVVRLEDDYDRSE